MNSKPLVSILVPAYNARLWIADTVRSALAQTWPHKEIIIVDDGSKDDTLALLQKFSAANVKVVTQPNQGAAAARNHALSLAQGDYILWLDADDLLAPEKISRQMQVAEECADERILLSSGWAYFFYRTSKAKFQPSPLWESLTPLEWTLRKLENNLHLQTSTWLTSRSLTEIAGPWDTRLLGDDDGEYFGRVIKACAGIRFVPVNGVYYRLAGAGSLSYISRSDKKMEAQFLGMKLQMEYLRSLGDDARSRAACVTYLQNWLPNFFPQRMDLVERAKSLARELGGNLEDPKLSWKYRWIQQTLGWSAAKRAQVGYNEWKSSVVRTWDRTMFRLERRADN